MNRPGTWGEDGVRARTSEANWNKPLVWNRRAEKEGKRLRVFCASLADIFEPRPELGLWREELFAMIEATPHLDWLLLTKRPDVARDWLQVWADSLDEGYGGVLPPNVWLGTSIENARHTWRADVLREIPAAVRFLSCEPLLGSLYPAQAPGQDENAHKTPPEIREPSSEGGRWARTDSPDAPAGAGAASRLSRAPLSLDGIDWVIVGGESGGRDARPMHPDWAREIRDAVLAAGMPPGGLPHGEHPRDYGYERPAFHFKQWGSWAPAGFVSMLPGPEKGPLQEARVGAWQTYYRGPNAKSAGKLLDGREWCEIPGSPASVPA